MPGNLGKSAATSSPLTEQGKRVKRALRSCSDSKEKHCMIANLRTCRDFGDIFWQEVLQIFAKTRRRKLDQIKASPLIPNSAQKDEILPELLRFKVSPIFGDFGIF